MLKSLFLSLALREINKGGSRLYSSISASTTLSSIILLNLCSVLLIGEYFFGSLFTNLNDFLFSQKNYITTALVSFFTILIVVQQRYKSLDLVTLAKQAEIGFSKFITYGVISGIVFISTLLVGI